LVAGPGTGKSSVIEERIRWLLLEGVPADAIHAVSFTRASSRGLKERIVQSCKRGDTAGANEVRVTTLHALALRTLRRANLLAAYPVEPLVLDDWEQENLFDAEYGNWQDVGKKRCEEIRREHEAYWSTNDWNPANYARPEPPIAEGERQSFADFHLKRTHTYSCVLPGEMVRTCVDNMRAGVLDAVALLGLRHLVVDEFQDLNPMDLDFIKELASQGAQVFIAGDDDQSIYSFRFASPAGIQDFASWYPSCGQHTLEACFRCTPSILVAGQALLTGYAQPNRIPKALASLYIEAEPPLEGVVHRWHFPSAVGEARAIAKSCLDLVNAGIDPRSILVLLNNKLQQLPVIEDAFNEYELAFDSPRSSRFIDLEPGRYVLALARLICRKDDYVAHRLLLGLPRGVGVATCNALTEAVIANNLNYRSIFYETLPSGVFRGRAQSALNRARSVCAQVTDWTPEDSIQQRTAAIAQLLRESFSEEAANEWESLAAGLPEGMTFEELRDYLWADNEEQRALLLQGTMTRLGIPIPEAGLLPPRIRIMTMHGAKGLSAQVVFVPGLEQDLIPGPRRQPYPGLVLEAARLVYVSVTRARAACVISYARSRTVYGMPEYARAPSPFTTRLGGRFSPRTEGLTAPEVLEVARVVSQL
jgi:DNA helicase-2/ATP-dependent DNA helicase PcrA